MSAMCPNCGKSLKPDAPVKRDGWFIAPYGPVIYDGRSVPLSPARTALIYTIAAANQPVTLDALLNRISDSDDYNLIAVQMTHIRRELRSNNIPIPFASLWGTRKVMWVGHDNHLQ